MASRSAIAFSVVFLLLPLLLFILAVAMPAWSLLFLLLGLALLASGFTLAAGALPR